jgi:hypothetical protein
MLDGVGKIFRCGEETLIQSKSRKRVNDGNTEASNRCGRRMMDRRIDVEEGAVDDIKEVS